MGGDSTINLLRMDGGFLTLHNLSPPTNHYTEVTMNDQLSGMQPGSEPMSVKDWFVTILISAIPLVGFIMLLVWAFDASTNTNKKNWAKASLLWMLIWVVLAVIFFALFAGLLMSLGSSYNN
jgi:Na+/proline symporter